MNYLLIFKGVAGLTEEEKKIELMQRIAFRSMIALIVQKAWRSW